MKVARAPFASGTDGDRGADQQPRWLEPLGFLLLLLGGLYVAVVPGGVPGLVEVVARMLALAGVVFACSRWLSGRHGWLVPLVIVVCAALLAYLRSERLLLRPFHSPLGYSNATGSFYMLAAAAALQLSARLRGIQGRRLGWVAAAGFAAVPWLNATMAAAALALFLPLGFLARDRRRVRLAVLGAGGAAAVCFMVTLLLGASYDPLDRSSPVAVLADATLGERRVVLWHDALVLLQREPVTGAGLGHFPSESPTARANPDTAWPHNELLHAGAEAGLIGLLLLGGVFAWGFGRLWWGGDDPAAGVAAIALGAVCIHASIDYVLHTPAIVAATCAIVAAGSRRSATSRHPTSA